MLIKKIRIRLRVGARIVRKLWLRRTAGSRDGRSVLLQPALEMTGLMRGFGGAPAFGCLAPQRVVIRLFPSIMPSVHPTADSTRDPFMVASPVGAESIPDRSSPAVMEGRVVQAVRRAMAVRRAQAARRAIHPLRRV